MQFDALLSGLLASKLRIAFLGLLVVGVSIGGAFAVGVLGVPGIDSIDNTFGPVTDETTTIETELVISNPNPIGIGLQDVSVNYTISMNGIEMAHGERDGVAIGTGNSTLELETLMRNDAIPPWWTSHIENDERTTVGIDATVTSARLGRSTDVNRTHEIETDLIGAFNSDETRPVNADHVLTEDPILYINQTRGEWGLVSDAETPIDMTFVVFNPNVEPYVIAEMGYVITMNDIVMGEGESHEEHVISSRSTEPVQVTTILDNQQLDEWWVSHLDDEIHGHQVSELRIEFYVVVELPTGDEITVPLDELTYEETIETDIFDEGGDIGEPTESTADSDPDDDGDEAEDGAQEGEDNGAQEDDDEANGSGDQESTEDDDEADDSDDADDGLPL